MHLLFSFRGAILAGMTKQDRFRLSGETGLHPNTVQKWARGEKVSTQSAYALTAAAKKLRIALPEQDDATGTEG